jgi:hypothetical protein
MSVKVKANQSNIKAKIDTTSIKAKIDTTPGSRSLNSLSDTSIQTSTDGDIIIYNDETAKW